MFWLIELVDAWGEPIILLRLPALLAIALVLFAEGHVPKMSVPVGVISIVGTVVALLFMPAATPASAIAPSESGAILVLVAWTLRRFGSRFGKWGTVLLIIAAMAIPMRNGLSRQFVALEFIMLVALVAALIVGIYLHSVDARRRNALTEVRRGERIELARDLHDFVAHHVTGIVVQAQAAQYASIDDPQQSQQSFAAIEEAGMEALASMRRLVSVLRDDGTAGGTRPMGDLNQISTMVDQFSTGRAHASLHVSPDLAAESLAPEVAATAFRVVQEALTNVNKHSANVETVSVALMCINDDIEVSVRDDGRSSPRTLLSSSGGGYGLAGLRERVEALDGKLSAGPRPEGGWEVLACMRLTRTTEFSTKG